MTISKYAIKRWSCSTSIYALIYVFFQLQFCIGVTKPISQTEHVYNLRCLLMLADTRQRDATHNTNIPPTTQRGFPRHGCPFERRADKEAQLTWPRLSLSDRGTLIINTFIMAELSDYKHMSQCYLFALCVSVSCAAPQNHFNTIPHLWHVSMGESKPVCVRAFCMHMCVSCSEALGGGSLIYHPCQMTALLHRLSCNVGPCTASQIASPPNNGAI